MRFDELKAAQKRLVSAQDEGRRRLERNIHDGAQQQLVALAVKLGSPTAWSNATPTKAHELLGADPGRDAHGAGGPARPGARDLPAAPRRQGSGRRARGAGPEVAAARSRSARTASVGTRRTSRRPCTSACLEAMQNVAKYAEASSVVVALAERDGQLAFIVMRRRPRVRSDRERRLRHRAAGDRRPARRARRAGSR